MKKTPYFALAGVLCSIAQGAQPDFTTLTHHWNFDEGRDWRNMPFPYANSPSTAMDSVGIIRLPLPTLLLPGHLLGRSPGRLSISGMLLQTPQPEPCGSCTLSCWLRVPAADVGITATIGNLAAKSGGVVQKNPMAGGNWHHVAFTRQPRSCWAGTSFCFCEYSVQDSVQNRVM